MLLETLIEEARRNNINVEYQVLKDPVIKSHMKGLALMGIFFCIVRKNRAASNSMKHNSFYVYQDYEMIDPIFTMQHAAKYYPASETYLIIDFKSYIDQIFSQHFSDYIFNERLQIYTQFSSFPNSIEFFSHSKAKTVEILLTDLNNKTINKLKLMAKDFQLYSITIDLNTFVEDLKSCNWTFDVGDYNDL